MRSDRGTRRADLQRRQRKKPRPVWLQRGLKVAGVVVLAAFVIGPPAWLWSSGWLPEKITSAQNALLDETVAAGLTTDNVFVFGRNETSAEAVLAALGMKADKPLLGFDPHAARARLETLPWVKEASVQRRFPDTVFVSLTERQPIGFLQKNRELTLVDADGTVLAKDQLGRWAGLPILIGENAPQRAPDLMRQLNEYPDIYRRVQAMTLVGERRWNLRMDNGVDVLLPEEDVPQALVRLARAQQESRLLEKDIESVDLRLADRLSIRPTAGANARREAPKEGI